MAGPELKFGFQSRLRILRSCRDVLRRNRVAIRSTGATPNLWRRRSHARTANASGAFSPVQGEAAQVERPPSTTTRRSGAAADVPMSTCRCFQTIILRQCEPKRTTAGNPWRCRGDAHGHPTRCGNPRAWKSWQPAGPDSGREPSRNLPGDCHVGNTGARKQVMRACGFSHSSAG
jgi:hypothetical protein